MDTWPIGSRDTTEFPKISTVSVQFREHLTNMIKQNGKDWNDVGPFGTPQRYRSYRKMYERIGIVCKGNDKLVTTWLGDRISSLERELTVVQDEHVGKLRDDIISVLSRYQFRNPADKDSLKYPADFDIQPCVCFWKIMLALDNKISYEEVNRVVLRVMHMADIDAAIAKIKAARETLKVSPNAPLDAILGLQVVTDQPTARIAGLFSQIGWGDLLITGVLEDRCRHLVDVALPSIKRVVEHPPKFYEAKTEDDWIRYFIGEPPLVAPVSCRQIEIDRLSVALELFKRERLTWTNKFSKGEPVYKSINTDVRAFFGDPQNWDAGGLKADANKFKDFCIQHTWMLQNGKGWTSLSHYSNADRVAFVDWLDEHVIRGIVPLAQTVCEDNGFKGITNKAVTELLMKFHPDQYCLCNAPTLEALHALDLLGMEVPDRYGYNEYQHVMGVCAQLRQRLADVGIVRVDGESDAPDYLTVNEFLYFVAEKKDLIMQEWSKHMKHEIKLNDQVKSEDFKFKDFVDAFIKAAQDAKLRYDDNLVRRFVCALMAKPFVVLTGLSGSGKTKLADAFTQWIGTDEMVKVVPVGADWTNNEKMLGYPNALDGKKYVLSDTGILKFLLDARDNPSVPFFLVLDEMNLSHVERYFADFLSAMESGKKIHLYDGDARMSNDGVPVPAELEIPKNLFVIGTMNVDETTYMFSPKVLDRAQVIEFRVSPDEMKTFLAAPTYPKMDALKGKGVIYATAYLGLAQKRGEKTISDADANKDLQDVLNAIFPELAKLGSEFAYRCAIEVVTFVAYYLEASGYGGLTDDGEKKQCRIAAVDAALLQKMLPKLHGSLNRLGPAIDVLLAKFTEPTGEDGDERKQIYPLSCDKLVRMRDRLEANGFTSYAEA